jgi:hypothetical protein
MVEINKKNVFLMKKIFCSTTYKLNVFEGSFIEKCDEGIKIYNFEDIKFDIIMANPPYQYLKKNNKKSQHIWDLFVKKSLKLININGYMLFIHPSGWRSPEGDFIDILNTIKKLNLIYLSMNSFETGKQIFNMGTNFDYYLLQNKKTKNNITKLKDIDGNLFKYNLNELNFIPSGKFEQFNKLIAKKDEEKVSILHSYIYEHRTISNTKDDNFKYPCCYSITQKDKLKCFYSDKKNGHFGIPKVIWSNGAGTYPIIDLNGKYGLTEFCHGIIDKKENLEYIKDALNNKKFIDLMKYVKFTDNKYNFRVIALFKKDFYKEFIDKKAKASSLKSLSPKK